MIAKQNIPKLRSSKYLIANVSTQDMLKDVDLPEWQDGYIICLMFSHFERLKFAK